VANMHAVVRAAVLAQTMSVKAGVLHMAKSEGLRQSQKQEKRLASKYDGQVSAASGAFWSRKGDVRSDRFLIEAKYTAAKSISIRLDVLEKIEREAIKDSRTPVLALSVGGRNYIVLAEDDFDDLVENGERNA